MSFNRWMNKLWCIHTVAYYKTIEKNSQGIDENIYIDLYVNIYRYKMIYIYIYQGIDKCVLLMKEQKPIWEGYILTQVIWPSWKVKSMATVKRYVVPRVMERAYWVGKAQRNFYPGKSTLFGNVVVDTWHYAFVKTHTNLQHIMFL